MRSAREMLTQNSLFRELDGEVLDRIASLAVVKSLAAGQMLFSKGDDGDALYGVVSGRIRISASSAGGKEVVLNIIEPGEVFGEIALLDGEPRTADASAMTATELLQIQRRDFVRYMETEPRLSSHLLKMLCQRLRATSELVEDSAFLSLPARMAKRLIALSNQLETGDDGELILSQQELGNLMDSSREAINKHLQTWRRQGWVTLKRNRITINNEDALLGLVESDGDR